MRVLAFVFALAVRPLEGPFLIGIVQSVFIIFARGSFFFSSILFLIPIPILLIYLHWSATLSDANGCSEARAETNPYEESRIW